MRTVPLPAWRSYRRFVRTKKSKSQDSDKAGLSSLHGSLKSSLIYFSIHFSVGFCRACSHCGWACGRHKLMLRQGRRPTILQSCQVVYHGFCRHERSICVCILNLLIASYICQPCKVFEQSNLSTDKRSRVPAMWPARETFRGTLWFNCDYVISSKQPLKATRSAGRERATSDGSLQSFSEVKISQAALIWISASASRHTEINSELGFGFFLFIEHPLIVLQANPKNPQLLSTVFQGLCFYMRYLHVSGSDAVQRVSEVQNQRIRALVNVQRKNFHRLFFVHRERWRILIYTRRLLRQALWSCQAHHTRVSIWRSPKCVCPWKGHPSYMK